MFPRLTKGVAFLKLWDRIGRADILASQTALAQDYIAIIASERGVGPFLPVTSR